jgi:hypothetical protein
LELGQDVCVKIPFLVFTDLDWGLSSV